jgi:Fe-S oxidoreductase
MCLETRQKIFQAKEKDALPNDFVYDYMIPRLKSLRNHQIISTSPVFTLSKAGKKNKSTSKRVFFPGCSLPAYSPGLVLKAYQYLQQKIPGIGIVLNCCGKPSRDIGDDDRFQNIFGGTLKEFSRLGIEEVVVACINCHKMYRENSEIKLRTIYEIMAEMGLPESISGGGQAITIHDSCPARYRPEIRNAVRQIASQMNFSVQEMKFKNEVTQCCGAGGCSPMGNTALADRHTRARAGQAKCQIVSYCAHCRERFSSYGPSLHILDLIFGASYNKHTKEYHDSWRNWLNRWYLKKRFQIMKI